MKMAAAKLYRFTASFLLTSLLTALPPLLCAQVDFGVGVGGDVFDGEKKKKPFKAAIDPFAQVTALAFDATTWMTVQISTEGAAKDLTRLLHQGIYRQELLELVLMASKAQKPLKDLVKKREKGKKLEKMAEELKLDYDGLYEQALRFRAKIDPLVPKAREALAAVVSTSTVSGSTETVVSVSTAAVIVSTAAVVVSTFTVSGSTSAPVEVSSFPAVVPAAVPVSTATLSQPATGHRSAP